MSGHTPGPWVAVHTSTLKGFDMFEVAEVSDMRVVPAAGGWPKAGTPEADARLIAAAPDLLEALRGLEPYLDAIVCYASTMDEYEPNRLAVQARAAIAKADSPKEHS